MIVKYLYLEKPLGELSRVSKQLRALCAPYTAVARDIPGSCTAVAGVWIL